MMSSFALNTTDKERLLRVIDEYLGACNDTLLHIHDADRYIHFRQVLGGSLKTTWDTIVTTHCNAFAHRTDANFNTDLRHFTRRYLPSNASQLQKEYLENPRTTKPHDFDCYETRARFELINRLSQYLPGTGGTPLYDDSLSQRNAYFRLMLPSWQLKFTENGNTTDDPTMNMDCLVDFMEQQCIHYNAQVHNHHNIR